MPRPRSDNEVEQIETQLAGLNKRLEEARARSKARKAAEDHRRWQLAGQCAVQEMQANPGSEFFKTIMALLDRHAVSAADRALFGLPLRKGTNGAESNGPSAAS
jgi:hypothetical protein